MAPHHSHDTCEQVEPLSDAPTNYPRHLHLKIVCAESSRSRFHLCKSSLQIKSTLLWWR